MHMTDKDIFEIEPIEAMTALGLKQAQTAFWKTGVAILLAGAAICGVAVLALP